MNIVCIGGGPAGLYFGLLMKKQDPRHEVVVVERNRAVRHVRLGRRVLRPDARQSRRGRRADRADDPAGVQPLGRHRRVLQGPQGHVRAATASAASAASGLLNILQARCEALGVQAGVRDRRRPTSAPSRPSYGADLVIGCDGINSGIRARYQRSLPAGQSTRADAASSGSARSKRFDAFTFAFEETEHGWFQAHIYQFDGDTSTFIVETPEEVWQRAGLDRMSQEEASRFCERLFAALARWPSAAVQRHAPARLGDLDQVSAHRLRQLGAPDRRGRQGGAGRADGRCGAHRALLDRLRHEARARGRHRARALLRRRIARKACDTVLAVYQDVRSVEVLKIQSAARNSMEWFENVDRYTQFEAEQFAYSMLTRSQRIPHENLRLRDAGYVEGYESWVAAHVRAGRRAGAVRRVRFRRC